MPQHSLPTIPLLSGARWQQLHTAHQPIGLQVAELETKNAAMWSLLQERDRKIQRLEAELETSLESASEARSTARSLQQEVHNLGVQKDRLEADLLQKGKVAAQLVEALQETKQEVADLVHGAVGAYSEELDRAHEAAVEAQAQVAALEAEQERFRAEGAESAAAKELIQKCEELEWEKLREIAEITEAHSFKVCYSLLIVLYDL